MRAIYLLFVLALLASACRSGGAQMADRTPVKLDGRRCSFIEALHDEKTNKAYFTFAVRLENGDVGSIYVPLNELLEIRVGQFSSGEDEVVKISGQAIPHPSAIMEGATIWVPENKHEWWVGLRNELRKQTLPITERKKSDYKPID